MLNVGQLNEGFVLDHIEAGKAMDIYNYLGLGKLDCQVAIIKNARSSKMGRKDIIKIESLSLPKQITNVIRCKNPRCITSIEQELDQVFVLSDPEKQVYRCKYCEEKYTGK